ncbi:fatty acid desaturase family protein [Myxococcus xanthus]|uniref:Fatty acid desaturase n=1 Tax=Myxococcus xanthus TaxID=34 RepID=A0AAE6G6A3_MYXXA|nr:fatty acid desaturase [Myxococcus xanthus]QDE71765.1 fatty acid desaturase [Myxococcus xanthus]QDE79046.1 fatty acid desaturase [Myxococcus xanthus]QDE86423.1 fatty acid desaturase [Myxococcus xanthus]QDF00583.1 fatty acid desaturase [Myxococcus xanthus]QDF08393.1 fatty acid desaturase [Myxococcus xanthus]
MAGMLRYAADRRTMLWCLAMPVVALSMYVAPGWIPYLCPLACYLALSAGVIAHNHNHCPTFRNRKLNEAMGMWLSLFYGYPTFVWIPTHNLNHHKFVNKAGDATITWRYSKKHNFLVAFLFPFVSTYWQQEPTKAFIDKARERNRPLYRQILTQYAVWGGTHAALLGLAMAMHGVAGGARIWAFAFLVPALFSLWTIMFFNYIQHVHTDPWSEHDHSRSFTGRLINFFLFNNGLHAVHHETPGLHWSLLPQEHAKIEAAMDPALKPVSFFAWCFRSYVVAPFLPRFGTAQVGRAPYEPPAGVALDVRFGDDLQAVDSGVNVARV